MVRLSSARVFDGPQGIAAGRLKALGKGGGANRTDFLIETRVERKKAAGAAPAAAP